VGFFPSFRQRGEPAVAWPALHRFLSLLLFFAGLGPLALRAEPVTVFTGARLIDGTGSAPIEHATLVVQDGRIVAAGQVDPAPYLKEPGAITIACEGKTIMPALISDHSHLGIVRDGKIAAANYTPENVEAALRQYEGYGVEAVLSLGMNRDLLYDLQRQQRAGTFGGADIFTADRGLGVPTGGPPLPIGDDQIMRPATPDEARQDVRAMAARHPQMIKFWLDDFFGQKPKMPPEICLAIIDEAHRQGLRAAAHIFYLADAKFLVAHGLDVVAHSVRDKPVDAEFLALMKAHHTAYIPTLDLDESQYIFAEHPAWMQSEAFRHAEPPDLLQKWLSPAYAAKMQASSATPKNRAAHLMAMRNVKTVYDAGVLVGFGTDSGAMPTRLPGWAEHRELQLLVKAGLSPMDAIVCATRNAAQVLGESATRGTLAPGQEADFLVLAGNPLGDIRNTTRLDAIYHRGHRIEPAFHELASTLLRESQ
jgi:imidazolonepropionase-like amidohydrolase